MIRQVSTRRTVRMIIAACLLTAGFLTASFAGAQADPSGSYTVVGNNPDGTEYAGTLKVTDLVGTLFYRFDWEVGESYSGLGIVGEQGEITVVWGPETSACLMQVFFYEEGGMSGLWVDSSSPEPVASPEAAFAKRVSADGLSGSYDVQGANPDGSEYEGSLTVTAAGDGQYLFIWNVAGESYTGVGFPEQGYIPVVASLSGDEGTCGQSSFQADGSGNLSGFWWTNDPSGGYGSEVANKEGGGGLGKIRRRWRVERQ